MAPEHEAFVTVYHSIGGWKAVLMTWEEMVPGDEESGAYSPWQTWFAARNRDAAIADARAWAEADGIEFRL